MGLYDRDYSQNKFEYRSYRYKGQGQGRQFGIITPVVKALLIANAIVFVVMYLGPKSFADGIFKAFAVLPQEMGYIQIWRMITYQFLHAGFSHFFFNMIGLFFFGSAMERTFGSKKFLVFYLICGAAGGVFYPLLVLINWLPDGFLVGASGGILGCVAGVAMMHPKARVYVWGIFPMPIVFIAALYAMISILSILTPDKSTNAGGEAAHLAGMAAAVIFIIAQPTYSKFRLNFNAKKWDKERKMMQDVNREVDRILQKVSSQGMHSLNAKEKRILRKATQMEQQKKKDF